MYLQRCNQQNIRFSTYRVDCQRELWRGIVAQALYNLSGITELGIIILIMDLSSDPASIHARQLLIEHINNIYVIYTFGFHGGYFPYNNAYPLSGAGHMLNREVQASISQYPAIFVGTKYGNAVGDVARFRTNYYHLNKTCTGHCARKLGRMLTSTGYDSNFRDSPGTITIHNLNTILARREFLCCWDSCCIVGTDPCNEFVWSVSSINVFPRL